MKNYSNHTDNGCDGMGMAKMAAGMIMVVMVVIILRMVKTAPRRSHLLDSVCHRGSSMVPRSRYSYCC